MIRVRLTSRWCVQADATVRLPASAQRVWQHMTRFQKFVGTDPYHTRITDADGRRLDTLPPRGTRLLIGHGLGWTWFERVGTMLYVREGRGFAFSDLSSRGCNAGFPHVYAYTVEPCGEGVCVLRLRVRGRWSARWMPRGLVVLWLGWVVFQAQWLLRARLLLALRRNLQVRHTRTNVERLARLPLREREV